jgi:cytochrome P450
LQQTFYLRTVLVSRAIAEQRWRDSLYTGIGIFNSDGDEWRAHRAAARPFFSKSNISDFTIHHRHADQLIEAVARLSADEFGATAAVDAHDLVARFTLDAATDLIFGKTVVRISPFHSHSGSVLSVLSASGRRHR